MQHVRSEIKYWDPCRVGKGNGTRRVPDILCTSPDGLTDYVIDCRISWQVTSLTGNNGFASYTQTGCKAEAGEKEKRDSWDAAIRRRQDIACIIILVLYDNTTLLGDFEELYAFVCWVSLLGLLGLLGGVC